MIWQLNGHRNNQLQNNILYWTSSYFKTCFCCFCLLYVYQHVCTGCSFNLCLCFWYLLCCFIVQIKLHIWGIMQWVYWTELNLYYLLILAVFTQGSAHKRQNVSHHTHSAGSLFLYRCRFGTVATSASGSEAEQQWSPFHLQSLYAEQQGTIQAQHSGLKQGV